MKHLIVAAALIAVTGSAMAASSNESGSAVEVDAQKNAYTAQCADIAKANGLKDEELADYIAACLQELSEKETTEAGKEQG